MFAYNDKKQSDSCCYLHGANQIKMRDKGISVCLFGYKIIAMGGI
jgi:hypothetical protein